MYNSVCVKVHVGNKSSEEDICHTYTGVHICIRTVTCLCIAMHVYIFVYLV